MFKKIKSPCAVLRGAIKKPSRPKITAIWDWDFTRIAGGHIMLKNPEWFEKTAAARILYRSILLSGTHDEFDNHPSCSYREYDEVMFYRICKKSGIEMPTEKNCFLNGKYFNAKYRDIHLGDFKLTTGMGRYSTQIDCHPGTPIKDCGLVGRVMVNVEAL